MSYMLPLIAVLAAADPAFAPRLEVLRVQAEALRATPVPEALAGEKAERLDGVLKQIAAGVGDAADFSAVYDDLEDTRLWLWANASEHPMKPVDTFEETESTWRVSNSELTVAVDRDTLAVTISTPAATWAFEPGHPGDVEWDGQNFGLHEAKRKTGEAFHTGFSQGMILRLSEFGAAPGFSARLVFNLTGSEALLEINAADLPGTLESIYWPKPITMGNTKDDACVVPMMQGMLLPGDWPQEIHRNELSNSRALYMPWWGQIRSGHGVQAILETDDDGGAIYGHLPGGPTRIGPRWWASLGQLRYQRQIRYVFSDGATYVTMAKRYRRYVQEKGHFVSLEEKRVRTPALDEVIGKPVIHVGALYHTVRESGTFNKEYPENNTGLIKFDTTAEHLKRVKAAGIPDAYVHLDGWGYYGYDNGHPDIIPPGYEQGGWDGFRRLADTCDELGYLLATHDQYRDFYLNAASFDDRLALTNLDGNRFEVSQWCGGPQTVLSPRFAPGYVRRNHDALAAHGIKVRGAYLDVFSVIALEESAQPAHPLTRSECAEYRRECFDILRARGYVVSSEEPAEYLVRSLDLVHHGPYCGHNYQWVAGEPIGIPIPLFNLVYHDSLLLPWDFGEDGGWGIPGGMAGRLHCLLNAGLPYLSLDPSPEHVAQVKEAAELARRCGTLEMVNHEFLDETNRKQRATYSDGTRVTVDFDSKDYTIAYGK